jgi:cytochrome c oxidase subunit 1
MLDDKLGKLHFITMFVGFNVTFFPMHLLGLEGMPRRIATYSADRGWEGGNLIATIGAFMIALSVLIFIWNYVKSVRAKQEVPADPWEGNTLEWMIPSPPPEFNFAKIPTVHSDRPALDARSGDQSPAHH